MTGLRRTIALAALALMTAPAHAAAFDVKDDFAMAVEMLQRGKKDEALKALQKVIAQSPDQATAYELWRGTDYAVWRDMLVLGGDFELSAKRLIELARQGRAERKKDDAAISELVAKVVSSETDALERRKALRTLSADHGEYAVPALIAGLGSDGDDEGRVLAMHALSQMGAEVGAPLCVALASEDAVLRRNICFVLGNLGDARSVGALQKTAMMDGDESVKNAAAESLAKLSATGDAESNLLKASDGYYAGRDMWMREAGDVVWGWSEGRLVGTPIPTALYGVETSRRAALHALAVNPASTAALARVARGFVGLQVKCDALTAAGVDCGDWKTKADAGVLAVNAAGVDALDAALADAVTHLDASSGGALCRVLAGLAKGPTAGLEAALRCSDGALSSEAAVALAHIATRSGGSVGADVVTVLGAATGREALRLALVVDGDEARGSAIAAALTKNNVHANRWTSGAKALGMLHRAPALDVIIVADSLPDLTTAQVIDEVRSTERFANTPILVATADAEGVASLYEDRIKGTLTTAEDMASVMEAMAGELSGDRALAETLAARSASALAHVGSKSDLKPAYAGLHAATKRADTIAVPALHALGAGGSAACVDVVLAVLADDTRSDEARVAAGGALSDILARTGGALSADGNTALQGVVNGGASPMVKAAAARAFGNLAIDAATRAQLLGSIGN